MVFGGIKTKPSYVLLRKDTKSIKVFRNVESKRIEERYILQSLNKRW